MQFLAAAILGAFVTGMTSLVGRVLFALGLGWISYTGISTFLQEAENQAKANIAALPQATLEVLGALKIDIAISILISAIATRLVLTGLTGGKFRRLVSKS